MHPIAKITFILSSAFSVLAMTGCQSLSTQKPLGTSTIPQAENQFQLQ